MGRCSYYEEVDKKRLYCTYTVYMSKYKETCLLWRGVRIMEVSLKRGSTVLTQFMLYDMLKYITANLVNIFIFKSAL